MEISFSPSMRSYFLRAVHEWCQDQGLTPYVLVAVDQHCEVPLEYVQNNQIVLNVSLEATQGFVVGDEIIQFKGRFSGRAQDVMVPVGRVAAIYAKENGHGMSFPIEEGPSSPDPAAKNESKVHEHHERSAWPHLRRVK